MKDPFKIPRWQDTHFVPPPPPQTLTVDAAEFVALRTIVMVTLSFLADRAEKDGGPQAQRWINSVGEVAAEAVKGASIQDDNERELDGLKKRAADHVNSILAGIKFPQDQQL
jgi:hypothetical protein